MNQVVLIGRLTKNPEIRWTPGENSFCTGRFTLAVDRRFKREGSPSADFISCEVLGKNAENAERLLRKGIKIAVNGRWQTGSFQGRDGKTVYTNDCIVENWEFVESKSKDEPNDEPRDPDGFIQVEDRADLPFA